MREAFVEVLDPGRQMDFVLPISQEVILPRTNPKKEKAILLVRAEEIECLNFRFTTESLTSGEIVLRLFVLTRDAPNCEELICNRGSYRGVRPKCRKILYESDMFMLQIDIRAPLHFLCAKFLVKVKPVQSYMLEGHH